PSISTAISAIERTSEQHIAKRDYLSGRSSDRAGRDQVRAGALDALAHADLRVVAEVAAGLRDAEVVVRAHVADREAREAVLGAGAKAEERAGALLDRGDAVDELVRDRRLDRREL